MSVKELLFLEHSQVTCQLVLHIHIERCFFVVFFVFCFFSPVASFFVVFLFLFLFLFFSPVAKILEELKGIQ